MGGVPRDLTVPLWLSALGLWVEAGADSPSLPNRRPGLGRGGGSGWMEQGGAPGPASLAAPAQAQCPQWAGTPPSTTRSPQPPPPGWGRTLMDQLIAPESLKGVGMSCVHSGGKKSKV